MKLLATKYHSQRNNHILPFVTCGTTVLAEYLSYLADQSGKEYPRDDDEVFERLNSPEMETIVNQMIAMGIVDVYAKSYRKDNPNTPDVDESQYNHFNNFTEILCACGNMLTNSDYLFSVKMLHIQAIRDILGTGMPVITSGKFTAGGHYVLIVGFDNGYNWIVDDPWGDWNKGYKSINGEQRRYDMQKVLELNTGRDKYLMKCAVAEKR